MSREICFAHCVLTLESWLPCKPLSWMTVEQRINPSTSGRTQHDSRGVLESSEITAMSSWFTLRIMTATAIEPQAAHCCLLSLLRRTLYRFIRCCLQDFIAAMPWRFKFSIFQCLMTVGEEETVVQTGVWAMVAVGLFCNSAR